MHPDSLKKLKQRCASVAGASVFHFGFAPTCVLEIKEGTKGGGKAEPVFVIHPSQPVNAANFAVKIADAYEEKVKVAPSLVYAGTLRKGKVGLLLEVDARLSKGSLDVKKAQLALRLLGKQVGDNRLATSILSLEPISSEREDVEVESESETESEDAPPRTPVAGLAEQERDYDEKLGKLAAVLRGLASVGSDQATVLARRVAAAKKLGDQGHFGEALAALEEAAGLAQSALRAAADAKAARDTGAGPAPQAFTKSRLIWSQARDVAASQLRKLQLALRSDPRLRQRADFASVESTVADMDKILAAYDERLIDSLDAYAAAQTPEEKAGHARQAAVLIRRYRATMADDELLQSLDANPFADVKVYEPLDKSLAAIAKLLEVS